MALTLQCTLLAVQAAHPWCAVLERRIFGERRVAPDLLHALIISVSPCRADDVRVDRARIVVPAARARRSGASARRARLEHAPESLRPRPGLWGGARVRV